MSEQGTQDCGKMGSEMQVVYFDEVKYQKGRSPFYWLGAIVANAELIGNLERQANDLAEEVFGTRTLTKETELHASAIFNGNHHFKGWTMPKRIDTLKKFVTIFGAAQGLGKIYVKMDVGKTYNGADVEGMAFMFLLERVDLYLRFQKSPGILIGDRENETIAGKFAEELSRYRTHGTEYQYGVQLERLLDTVHFTHSHHSRMLQLADLHTWLRQLLAADDRESWPRKQVLDHVSTIKNCLSPNRYKEFPPDNDGTKWFTVSVP
jgi:hypothetical protein